MKRRIRQFLPVLLLVGCALLLPAQRAAALPVVPFASTGDLFVLVDDAGAIVRVNPADPTQLKVVETRQRLLIATGGADLDFDDAGLTFDETGNLYFTERISNTVLKRSPQGPLSVLVSQAAIEAVVGETNAGLRGITLGSDGLLYAVNDTGLQFGTGVLRIDPATGAVSLFASGDAIRAAFESGVSPLPSDLPDFNFNGIVGAPGNLFIAVDGEYPLGSNDADAVLQIALSGAVTVFSSLTGTDSFDIDNFLTRDAAGNLYVADDNGDPDQTSIRKVDSNGTGSFFLTSAQLNGVLGSADPEGGLAFDAAGNFYMSDFQRDAIFRFGSDGSGSLLVSEAQIGILLNNTPGQGDRVDPDLGGGLAFLPGGVNFANVPEPSTALLLGAGLAALASSRRR